MRKLMLIWGLISIVVTAELIAVLPAQTIGLYDGSAIQWAFSSANANISGNILHLDGRTEITKAFWTNREWSDMTLSAEFKVDPAPKGVLACGFIFRAQNESEYYYVHYDRTQAILVRAERNRYWNEIKRIGNLYKPAGQWIKAKVECAGSLIRVYLNGKLLYEATDNVYTRGNIGFYASQGNVQIRNINVKGNALPARNHFNTNLDFFSDCPVRLELLEVKKIWDRAKHNAFTDLVNWKGDFYCVFREGKGHVSGDGRIRVLVSPDAESWRSAALLSLNDYDLRDAALSITPDNRLMLSGGAAEYIAGRRQWPATFVCFTNDGRNWSTPAIVIPRGRWLWRARWYQGKCYGFAYGREGQGLNFLSSTDGLKWNVNISDALTEAYPTEVQVRFDSQGSCYALIRRDRGSAFLGKSTAGYSNWYWYNLDRSALWGKPNPQGTAFRSFGGPNFIETLPGCWIAGGRMHEGGEHMALTWLDVDAGTMQQLMNLPSRGDCGYPGMVWKNNMLYISYYSSHKGKAAVFLAKVKVIPLKKKFSYVCKDAGVGSYEAFPDICRLADGRLFCCFYAGYDHVSPPTRRHPKGGRISYCLSEDEGRTWTRPHTLYDGPDDDRDPSITQLDDGKLICVFFNLRKGAFSVTSNDLGQTWSVPRQLAPAHHYVSSPIRKLSTGRLILGLYHEGRSAYGEVIFSDDNGETWSDIIPIDNNGLSLPAETDVIELQDGTLYAIQRDDMAWSKSRDLGKTWTPSRPTGFTGHCPFLYRTVEGLVLLGTRAPGSSHWSTCLRYSSDECQTWSNPFEVDPWGNGGYPSMVNLRDGSVLMVYYDDKGEGYIDTNDDNRTYRTLSNIRARRFNANRKGIHWFDPDEKLNAPADVRLIRVRKIWDKAKYNSFTDLLYHGNRFYCVFREALTHGVNPSGAIRIITSTDGKKWKSLALVGSNKGDLRDPHMTITPDKQFMLNVCIANLPHPNLQSAVLFSSDAVHWTEPILFGEKNSWLWRVTWHGNRAFGFTYRCKPPWGIQLLCSQDGKHFTKHSPRYFSDRYANETSTIIFKANKTAVCLLRSQGPGAVGIASAPYDKWLWKRLPIPIGGPEIIQLPDQRIVACGRIYDKPVHTSLLWLNPEKGSLEEFLRLPSGGDTSYPGLLWHKGKLFVSYYSSHEGKSAIYLAEVIIR